MSEKYEIIIYQAADGLAKIEVCRDGETIWLNQAQIAQMYGRERSVIIKHIRNIYADGELTEKSNVQNMHIPNSDKSVVFYNLDVVLAVGYRVKSPSGTQFRQWATQILHEYLLKGFSMNGRLKDMLLRIMKGGKSNE